MTDEKLYPLPEGWQWTQVGLWANILRGVSYKKNDAHHAKQDDDCLILRGGNISEGNIDTTADDNVYVSKNFVAESQLVKQNDIILVASTGSKKVIGRAGISNQNYSDTSFGAFLMLVRPLTTLNPRYMDYFFQSEFYRNLIRNLAKGTNINNIRTEHVTEMPFPLPPLDEQQRIVNLLDELFADLDKAKALAQGVVDGSKLRRAAILHKAFTGELTKLWRDEHGTTPDGWQWTFWGKCGTFVAGSAFKKECQGLKKNSIPFYKVGSLKFTNDVGYLFDESDTITEEIRKTLKAKLIPPNALFFAKIGEAIKLNRRALNNVPCCIDNNLIAFISEKVLFRYAYYWSFTVNLYEYTNATTVPSIRKSDLEQIPIPLPPLDEQKEIVRLLDYLLDRERRTTNLATKTLERIKLMKKSILARAFRGELS